MNHCIECGAKVSRGRTGHTSRDAVRCLVCQVKEDLRGWRYAKGKDDMNRPTIVCLCGSTRFYTDFMEQNYQETMAGRIVLSVGFYPHAVNEMHGEGVGITPEQKEELDQLHLRKVELADEVLVLNRGGYIGSSTARELAHARKLGKVVRFLEEPTNAAA